MFRVGMPDMFAKEIQASSGQNVYVQCEATVNNPIFASRFEPTRAWSTWCWWSAAWRGDWDRAGELSSRSWIFLGRVCCFWALMDVENGWTWRVLRLFFGSGVVWIMGQSLQLKRPNHFFLESGLGRRRHMVDCPHSVLAGLKTNILSPSY